MQGLRGARTAWRNRNSDIRRLERAGRASVGMGTYGLPKILQFKHDETSLSIGSYCSIGEGVKIVLGGGHPTGEITTFPMRIRMNLPGAGTDSHPLSKGDINIGSDVWIGTGATILSGVTLGHGSIVGAGAVVSRSVEAYSIVVGNPASEIRKRFTDSQISALLRIAWWEWEPSVVMSSIDMLACNDILGFIDKYDNQ